MCVNRLFQFTEEVAKKKKNLDENLTNNGWEQEGKKKKKKEKSAIGYAISSRIGIYRDRGWPPPSYTRVERVVGREFSWSVRVRFPGRPFGRVRGRVWSGTRNTHFYQTLRGLERAGWKPISYTLVGIRRRYTSATLPSLSPLSTLRLSCLHTRSATMLPSPFTRKSDAVEYRRSSKRATNSSHSCYYYYYDLQM